MIIPFSSPFIAHLCCTSLGNIDFDFDLTLLSFVSVFPVCVRKGQDGKEILVTIPNPSPVGEHKASLQSTEIRKKGSPKPHPIRWGGGNCSLKTGWQLLWSQESNTGQTGHTWTGTGLDPDFAWQWLQDHLYIHFSHHGFGISHDFYSLPEGKPMRTSNSKLSLVKIKRYCHLVDRELIYYFF